MTESLNRRGGSTASFREKYLTPLGLEPVLDTPEQFAQFLREDRTNGARLVKQAGLIEN